VGVGGVVGMALGKGAGPVCVSVGGARAEVAGGDVGDGR